MSFTGVYHPNNNACGAQGAVKNTQSNGPMAVPSIVLDVAPLAVGPLVLLSCVGDLWFVPWCAMPASWHVLHPAHYTDQCGDGSHAPRGTTGGGGGHSEAGYGRPVDRGMWTAKTVKRPRQQPAHPQYANYWAPLTRKRHTMPHSAQPRHANYWAPRTRKRHQQEHRPQRPTERSDPTQHAKGRTGDRPGPRKETTTRRNVTQGGRSVWWPGDPLRAGAYGSVRTGCLPAVSNVLEVLRYWPVGAAPCTVPVLLSQRKEPMATSLKRLFSDFCWSPALRLGGSGSGTRSASHGLVRQGGPCGSRMMP